VAFELLARIALPVDSTSSACLCQASSCSQLLVLPLSLRYWQKPTWLLLLG
jgi:hypothetical protein